MALMYWRESTKVKERETSQTWPFPVALYTLPEGASEMTQEELNNADPAPLGTGNPLTVTNAGGFVTNIPATRVRSIGFNAAAAGDYAALDVVSNSVTDTQGVALQVADVVSAAGQVAILDKVSARCSEDSMLWRLALDFYAAVPTSAEVEMDDNVAMDAAKTVAGANKFIDRVPLAAMADMGTAMAASVTANLRWQLKTGAMTSLWINVITLDADASETAGMKIDIDLYFLN